MNLKYLGGILGLVGGMAGLVLVMITTGGDVKITGSWQLLYIVAFVAGAVGSFLSLRGTTRPGGIITLVSGVAMVIVYRGSNVVLPLLPGILFLIGGVLQFLYKEPVTTGSQWRIRRTPPPSGAS
jgi:hypothetical protein